MTMQTVYDADGAAFEVESVDAREYVESGSYSYEAPSATPEAPADKPKRGRKPAADAEVAPDAPTA